MNLGPTQISGTYRYVLNQSGNGAITLGDGSSVNWSAGGVVATTGNQNISGNLNISGNIVASGISNRLPNQIADTSDSILTKQLADDRYFILNNSSSIIATSIFI